jgi:hypothetical protein
MQLTFQSPEGWQMPEDATPGEPFQALGTFMADEDGNITLTEIDGTAIPTSEMEGEEEGGEIEIEMKMPEKEESDEEAMMSRAKKAGVFK